MAEGDVRKSTRRAGSRASEIEGLRGANRGERVSPTLFGVSRDRGAQITAWFAAGLSHAEIVLQSGKTHETIRCDSSTAWGSWG